MSNLTKTKTKIKNANMRMLKQAVEALIKERCATKTGEVKDYRGITAKVELGIKDSIFTRGIGFIVENGEVKTIGDTYQIAPHEITNLRNQLNKHYNHQSTTEALQTLGYHIVSQKVEQKIYMQAYALS